jgi:hypothetical protein
MPKRTTTTLFALALTALSGAIASAVSTAESPSTPNDPARIERGAYLVRTMGCNDCHTPWKMGPNGPEQDMSRALTGHPEDLVLPPPPVLPPGPWIGTMSATNTAFAGPWGISYTMNLTPDSETGLGDWTEEMFIQTMRTGRHEGKGRQLKPPMPWFIVGALNDEDIKSLWAYLRSLKAVRNRVPQPVDPPEGQ